MLAAADSAFITDKIHSASALGTNLDPVNGLDTATIVVGSVFFGLTSLLLGYAWLNYRYQPIRAKNLPQTSLMLFCGVLWFVGDIGANGHVNTTGIWANCRLWHLWFRFMFAFMFSSCVLARVLALYWLLVRRKKLCGWLALVPFGTSALCVLVFCVVGQLVSPNKTVKYDLDAALCLKATVYRACGLALQWGIWALVIVFMWLVRNIHSSFNEVLESPLIVLTMLITLLQTTVNETKFNPLSANRAARVSSTWIDFISANLIIWIILAYPVYQSMFNRKRYSINWRMNLVNDGFRREYALSGSTELGAESIYSVYPDGTLPLNYNSKQSSDNPNRQSWIYRHSLPVRFSQTFSKNSTDTIPRFLRSDSTICAPTISESTSAQVLPRVSLGAGFFKLNNTQDPKA
ncbi:hypothetical protein COEREDRAFT_96795 [Coemansia reversa NRRL 1564]|uniref:G-protein coupled receptors family 3 profile domain-containing protein n=1 Tax=Coemansia reversa (strain ATCC 12441 / NRRL 1564) TaxID=763665 RepID=A0A2G5BDV7_COERN|nr:hypothetical protein COEREDRAFT_96795 [Coemansia reversa NRRL 1564]|eukprot:PIA17198.1 hypothetical protein COEREDRAFT_96795 [Coemansia reversa NRRL 1564]